MRRSRHSWFRSNFVYKTGGRRPGHGLLAPGLTQHAVEGVACSQGLFLASSTSPTQMPPPCPDTGQSGERQGGPDSPSEVSGTVIAPS